jgi:hypothetical protein
MLALSSQMLKSMMLQSNELAQKNDFSMLDILHHFTAGIKAVATHYGYYGIDELRQACGGAGFSAAS